MYPVKIYDLLDILAFTLAHIFIDISMCKKILQEKEKEKIHNHMQHIVLENKNLQT